MKIKDFISGINSAPDDDFLGLSPHQMHLLLYGKLADLSWFLQFNETLAPTLLQEVPVVVKLTRLIKLIGEEGEVKATKNGNLPRKLVNALYDFSPLSPRFVVPSEEYALDILALRYAAIECKWLKKKSGKFSLTKKGQQLCAEGFTATTFVQLLKYWLREYNWAYTDRYSPCEIVQQAAVFSLYLLSEKADKYLAASEFTQLFIRAFPAAPSMVTDNLYFEETREATLERILRLRFLDRFAGYFGLVDYKTDSSLPYLERENSVQIKTTPLFKALFIWRLTADSPSKILNVRDKGLIH